MDRGNNRAIYAHKCVQEGCETIVTFDDEPWCYEHAPAGGPSFPGYSARKAAEGPVVHKNIFEP